MPLYEYKCRKCDTVFEKLVGPRDKAAEFECPECGSTDINRQFSSFAIGGKKQPAGLPSCASESCTTGSCPYAAG